MTVNIYTFRPGELRYEVTARVRDGEVIEGDERSGRTLFPAGIPAEDRAIVETLQGRYVRAGFAEAAE